MDQAAVIARLRKFEGAVPYMYRCTGGEVTIGVGHAIHQVHDAPGLKWHMDGASVTAEQVRADYLRVAAAPMGKVASSYKTLTRCRMKDEEIDALVVSDLRAFETQLAAAFPKWKSHPAPVQEALFDMAFNLGLGGLKRFTKLLQAIDAADWVTAAAQCHRQGIGTERNAEIAGLFQSLSSAPAKPVTQRLSEE